MPSSQYIATLAAQVARRLAVEKKDRLDALKSKHNDRDRPDFLWHYLLQSFATWGGSVGSEGLIRNEANYERLRYEVLASVPPDDRERHVLGVCRAAKLRWPEKKADCISAAFERIHALGGLAAANRKLFDAVGAAQKVKFLMTFKGIGDKYSRNLMMDIYHEDFRDSIAIDSRIKKLSKLWGLTFGSYEEHERFYLDVAAGAGLNGWELDRLLYNFQSEFVARVAPPSSAQVSAAGDAKVACAAGTPGGPAAR